MRSTLPTFNEVWQQQFKQRITQVIQQQFKQSATLYLGCSGGMDSMLLLHVLADLIPHRLHVLSIDHQLQNNSADWSACVATQCQQYGVACTVIPVKVNKGNLESAARMARYQAFERYLKTDDVLILAHHQQDQAETVMLRLLQGAGTSGLSAMQILENRQHSRHQYSYQLWRPFLEQSKQAIEAWANQLQLDYIDDPMNHEVQYDRVWCRDEVWPVLERRFSKMQDAICRSAQLMQDAKEILNDVLKQDFEFCRGENGELDRFESNVLALEKLQQLSHARQRQLLSAWMQADNLYRPPLAMVERLIREVIDARIDASSILHCAGYYFTRFDHKLYRYTAQQWQDFQKIPKACVINFNVQQQYNLALNTFILRTLKVGLDPMLLGQELTLIPRQGGEKIFIHGKSGHRPLKKLLQDAKIASWYRHQIQILMYHTTVLGVFTPQGFWLAHSPFCSENGWLPMIKNS